MKDPGSFTIPCTIGDLRIEKALCDLGASINLMPLSLVHRLGITEVKPTRVSLQLADRSVKLPYGIIEDVLVKVDRFFVPTDFLILDMEEDVNLPLILGRPFLATSRALIDVEEGELTLRFQNNKVKFKVFQAMDSATKTAQCYKVDVMEANLSTSVPTSHATPPWEPSLRRSKTKKKKKRVGDDDLKPPEKPPEAFHLPFEPNSISLVFGKKNHYLGDKSPKKGRKEPP